MAASTLLRSSRQVQRRWESHSAQTSVIFVAGGETLIGAAILRVLRQQGYSCLLGGPGEQVDLCDAAAVDAFFARHRPEYVFHAGGVRAASPPTPSIRPNWLTTTFWAAFTSSMPPCLRGAQRLLYLASSCSYPRLCPQPMQEENLLTGPLEPTNEAYAVAKLAGLKLCQAYRQQYGDDFLVGIPANAFGPGDDFSPEDSHVIAALIRRFHEAKLRGDAAVSIWGTGRPRREFIYVDDLADACLFVMQSVLGRPGSAEFRRRSRPLDRRLWPRRSARSSVSPAGWNSTSRSPTACR